MPIRTYRIDDELDESIGRAAEARGVPRALVVREALSAYLVSQAQRPAPSLVELSERLAVSGGSGVADLGSKSEGHLRAKLGSGKRGRRRPR